MPRIVAITLPIIDPPPDSIVNDSVRNSRHPMRERKAQNSNFFWTFAKSS
jgi:hypothetical protein